VQSSPYWYLWLVAFALTLLIEAPFVLGLLARSERSLCRRCALLVVANLATHPLVWFFFPELPLDRRWSLWLSEGWAFVTEAFVYAALVTASDQPVRARLGAAVLASAAANAVSWVLFTPWFWRHAAVVLPP